MDTQSPVPLVPGPSVEHNTACRGESIHVLGLTKAIPQPRFVNGKKSASQVPVCSLYRLSGIVTYPSMPRQVVRCLHWMWGRALLLAYPRKDTNSDASGDPSDGGGASTAIDSETEEEWR